MDHRHALDGTRPRRRSTLMVALALGGLISTACGATPSAAPAGVAPATGPPGSIVPGPPGRPDLLYYYESFDHVFSEQPLTVIVRATDDVWKDRPPGAAPAANNAYEERLPSDGTADDQFWFLWRKFEVVEVLRGDYDKPTINYGNFLDRTEAGKTYVLFGHVLMAQDGRFWRTDEDYGEGIPPYELIADGLLVSTDPDLEKLLPPTLTLAELRELIDD